MADRSTKRSSDCEDEGPRKFPRIAVPFIRLESESEIASETDSESELSVQMNSTASAKDTSDTSSKPESEYTLNSLSEGEVSEFSSGPDNVCPLGNFEPLVSDSEFVSNFADMSNSDKGSTDSEISKTKCQKCAKCGTTDKHPCFRLCIQCFREHKSGLPMQPKIRRGATLQQRSQPHVSDCDPPDEPNCGCCFEKPIDSAFLHGDIAHQIFCYNCSKKMWIKCKRCPCCNRNSKVIKVYRGPSHH